MQQVLDLLLMDIPGTGRKRMQHRLPHMGPAAVDQCDPAAHASEPWSKVCGQQQPGNAATDDDNARAVAWTQ
jgi:hypothetical protein